MNWPLLLVSVLVVLTAAVFGMLWFCFKTVSSLLPLIREHVQHLRSRTYELEQAREDLIRRLSEAQGVAASVGGETRTCWVDPMTGYKYFSDGEIQDERGQQITAHSQPLPKAGEDVPERIKERIGRWEGRYPKQESPDLPEPPDVAPLEGA